MAQNVIPDAIGDERDILLAEILTSLQFIQGMQRSTFQELGRLTVSSSATGETSAVVLVVPANEVFLITDYKLSMLMTSGSSGNKSGIIRRDPTFDTVDMDDFITWAGAGTSNTVKSQYNQFAGYSNSVSIGTITPVHDVGVFSLNAGEKLDFVFANSGTSRSTEGAIIVSGYRLTTVQQPNLT